MLHPGVGPGYHPPETFMSDLTIVLADNLAHLNTLEDGVARLVYIDPPFNTGRRQERRRLKTVRDDSGDRTGFQGKRYRTCLLYTSPSPRD